MKTPNGKGQLTLVALFGKKQDNHPELWSLIQQLQQGISTILGEQNFSVYDENRVHGTIGK